ncbi:MAG: sulfurtransferase [Pseudomonadota bacterium]
MKTIFASLAVLTASTSLSLALDGAGPLVDAQWVIENAADENVVILDIRADVDDTDLGDAPYIANSVAAPYNTAGWRTEIDGVPGKIPSNNDIQAIIQNLGIDNDDHVVIVPWGTNSTEFGGATRVYWTFKYLGHNSISILDGGWRQYEAAGGARSAEPITAEVSTFEINVNDDILATTADVEQAVAEGTKLIDGRPEEQFIGDSKSGVVARAGTIPGSLNLAHSNFFSEEFARHAQPETVAALTEAIGLAADEANITFCNTGHWASVPWFAISEVLGNKQTAMYDGSLAEWTQDDSRPLVDGVVN